MRKFDLELAKAGHLVCTCDGKPVRIICFDLKDTKYPIVAVVMNGDVETVNQYTNEGKYFGDSLESYNDLMMVSEVEESDIKEAIKYAIAASTHEDGILLNGVTESEAIAWLEKKCEQNPAAKAEPKFKVDNYLVTDYCKGKVIALTDDAYLLDTEQGIPFSCEHNAHLWTIQDAKDGDVLAFDKDTIVIFKDLYNATTFHSYCHIEDGMFDFSKDELPDWWEGEGFKPATKEQRDLLFQKMKEAGYEWDAKKKKLKKIEQTTMLETCEIENIEHGKYYYCIKDYFCGGRKQASKGDVVQALRGMSMMALGVKANEYFLPVNSIEQKPAWSEEDERLFQIVIDILDRENHKGNISLTDLIACVRKLKSLKDRVQQRNK